jgi:EAL domain-containing protein (putative c-di-GMP-specific phosphodiesterase class I)
VTKRPSTGATEERQFLEEMGQALTGWSDPAAKLRAALQSDALALYSQPILTLANSQFERAEVLVRMREEEETLLPPGEFLPVFEHFRMMPELDRWVVSRTVDHLRRGSRIGLFSINVSSQTLGDVQFPGFVADALRAARVPAAKLAFEIDESDALRQPLEAESFATAMKGAGCGLLIDGFGRRSVSFLPLKTLQVKCVKVDGSIVRKLLTSESALAKLKAVVRVGEVIGVDVLAECVEEQDVLARLKALGVGFAQGFGIAEPFAIAKLAAAAD